MRSVCFSVSVDVTISKTLKRREECGEVGTRHVQLPGVGSRHWGDHSGRRFGRTGVNLQQALARTSQSLTSLPEKHSPHKHKRKSKAVHFSTVYKSKNGNT